MTAKSTIRKETGNVAASLTGKSIVFLGASTDQAFPYREARAMGMYSIGIDANEAAYAMSLADETHVISIRDHNAIEACLGNRKIDGFYSQASDTARLSEYHLTRRYGCKKTVSIESVNASSDKAYFAEVLRKAGLPTPRQAIGSNLNDIEQATSDWSLPFVIKPNDSSGSKGVVVLTSRDELKTSVADAISHSPSNTVLGEELIIGTHYSLDTFVRDYEPEFMAVSQKTLTESPLMVPLHYVMPAGVSKDLQDRMRDCVITICRALKIEAGPITCDVVVDEKEDIYFIEMGARAGGNGISLLMEQAYGVTFVMSGVALAVGETIPVQASTRRYAGLLTFASSQAGIFMGIKNLHEVEKDRLIDRYEVFYKPETPVKKFNNGADKLGYVIVSDETEQGLKERLTYVHELLKITLSIDGVERDLDLL
ncbi:ATP-grasp domain-containing protein [Kiloniella sp. EL199]|uniref:ATP-grasp domain-containing protein n=1 Tax=Kiloniella sp. EL199 TaxID=2107581 RepID=UPI000EA16A61|nr:ATP-grasp domain-containing protein [Kiloniella sp. EL199]